MSVPHHSTHISQLKTLLQQNVSRVDAATKLGITPSAVTQLLAEAPANTLAVAASNAPSAGAVSPQTNELDDQYDRIEQKLLNQLEKTIPLLMRPAEIANVMTRVNAAKRRGGPLKQQDGAPRVLQLSLPLAIQAKFVLNQQNQVVAAGAQDLVTLPSSGVTRLLEESKNETHQEDEFGFTTTGP